MCSHFRKLKHALGRVRVSVVPAGQSESARLQPPKPLLRRIVELAGLFGESISPKVLFLVLAFSLPISAQSRELRVCADPDNLPFSNQLQQGFENHLAAMIARDMHAQLTYVWQRMGRGFVREYFGKNNCDMVVGIPTNYKQLLTTRPYYRSTYVFVSRANAKLKPASLNDPALHSMKIGVQVLGDDYAPPARALAKRGMQANIVGFNYTGDDAASILRAVAIGKVDTAMVWGPLAGYFARRSSRKLVLTPVTPEVDPPGLPFTFAISMGVRKGNTQLRDRLQNFLDRRQRAIDVLLLNYGIPIVDDQPAASRGNG